MPNVKPDEYYLSGTENLSDPVENHPSVEAVKQNTSVNQNLHFSNPDVSDILKKTKALNNKKKMVPLVISQQKV